MDSTGQEVELPPIGSGRTVTPVERDGERVAAIIHDASLTEDSGLVEAVGSAAALALENERLDAELRARLEDLRASRARLVEAGMAERRRLERDLHDGAQQRLVSLALSLRLARNKVDSDPGGAVEVMDGAAHELELALEELRELARGIHPAVLSDRGLDAALRTLAARAPLPVDLTTSVNGVPDAVESAAYFVVSEALTNVAKYAQASSAVVHVEQRARLRDGGGQRRRRRWRRPQRGHRPARPRRPPERPGRAARGGQRARAGHHGQGEDPVRVVVAEDSVLLREGVVRLLSEAGFDVVAQTGDADDLRRRVYAHKPDVAIVDVRMPPDHTDDGLRAALEIRDRQPATGVLVLSQYIEEGYALDLITQAGADGGVGYLLKDRVADVDRFLDAVRRVAGGGSALDPEVVAQLLGRRRRNDPLDALTPREREVHGADGRGPLQRGHRRHPGGHRARGREARHLDLPQARADAHGRGPPARAGRAGVPADVGAGFCPPAGSAEQPGWVGGGSGPCYVSRALRPAQRHDCRRRVRP